MLKIYMVSEAQKSATKRYHEKMKQDPEYRKKRSEQVKKYYDRNKDDPEFRQKINERSKKYYQAHREEILEKRKQKYKNQADDLDE
tara:strand:+ start:13302 stop:13559 length:258 start_codon:yes stop_codon:yes gene_type:complete